MAHVIDKAAWAKDEGLWKGEVELGAQGAGLSLIFNLQQRDGGGPRLHTHPYPETFILRTGKALFTVGDKQFEAVAGQILVVPADTPHKFAAIGPEPFESIDIHLSEKFATTWLE